MRRSLPTALLGVISAVSFPAQLVLAQTNASSTCPQITAALHLGMTDTDTNGQVSDLQQFLVHTIASSSLSVTGYFGAKTDMLVRQFQAMSGLTQSGIVSTSTSLAIEETCFANANISFDTANLLSLSAAPTLSGVAQGIAVPLLLTVRSLSNNALVYQSGAIIPDDNGSWTLQGPVLPVGTYQTALTADRLTLATATLAVGIPSLPSVLTDTGSLPVSDVADGRLMRFAIHAGSQADMSIGQLTFSLATDSADVSDISLYAYTDPAYSISATTSLLGNSVNDFPITPGSNTFTILPDSPITVPKGQTYFFELDGTVVPSADTYAITTSLLSDSFIDHADTFNDLINEGANFIWSPNIFGQTATSDPDWLNGSTISGLGQGLAQTRTGTPLPPPPPPPPPAPQVNPSTTTFSQVVATTSSATTTSGVSNATSTGDHFTATPTSGKYPLRVTFSGVVNSTKSCAAGSWSLYYGEAGPYAVAVQKNMCKSVSFTTTHTYNKSGVYTAALYAGTYTGSTTTKPLQSQIIQVSTTSLAILNGNTAAAVAAFSDDLRELLMWFTKWF